MTSQKQSRASPTTGLSIARQVMEDAINRYLETDGPAETRKHIDTIYNELSRLYDDCLEAYNYALNRIREEEKRQDSKRQQEELDNLKKALKEIVGKKSRNSRPSDGDNLPGTLPDKLSTPKAMSMLRKLQKEEYIDENFQPRVSRAKAAVMADEMSNMLSTENERLMGIDDKWKPFEILWGRSDMRADHYRALNQKKTDSFRKKIRELLEADT